METESKILIRKLRFPATDSYLQLNNFQKQNNCWNHWISFKDIFTNLNQTSKSELQINATFIFRIIFTLTSNGHNEKDHAKDEANRQEPFAADRSHH